MSETSEPTDVLQQADDQTARHMARCCYEFTKTMQGLICFASYSPDIVLSAMQQAYAKALVKASPKTYGQIQDFARTVLEESIHHAWSQKHADQPEPQRPAH